jgi:hypothetical protein
VYLATSQKNTKVLYENQRGDREFACTFKKDEKYSIEWLAFKAGQFMGVDTEKVTFNFTVGEDGFSDEVGGGLSIGIILLIVGIVLIVIGTGVFCYIRKRNANHDSRNAQLL